MCNVLSPYQTREFLFAWSNAPDLRAARNRLPLSVGKAPHTRPIIIARPEILSRTSKLDHRTRRDGNWLLQLNRHCLSGSIELFKRLSTRWDQARITSQCLSRNYLSARSLPLPVVSPASVGYVKQPWGFAFGATDRLLSIEGNCPRVPPPRSQCLNQPPGRRGGG